MSSKDPGRELLMDAAKFIVPIRMTKTKRIIYSGYFNADHTSTTSRMYNPSASQSSSSMDIFQFDI